MLGLDAGRFGTEDWNPLGDLVQLGQTVLVKPNLVTTSYRDTRLNSVITHASVLRPVIDYALKAIGPEGNVIIGDCPERDMDLDLAFALNGLTYLLDYYAQRGDNVAFVDFRNQFAFYSPASSPKGRRLLSVMKRTDNPVQYRTIDLGSHSAHADVPESRIKRYYGAYDNTRETVKHHLHGRHVYELVQPFLDADLVISTAKLKTHKKAGVTLTLKNLIGINGNKNLLPHHTEGDPSNAGDCYMAPAATVKGKVLRKLSRFLTLNVAGRFQSVRIKKMLESISFGYSNILKRKYAQQTAAATEKDIALTMGGWHGNDTLWRTVTDIARLAYFADNNGKVLSNPRQRFLGIVDGIISGEGDGPKHPTPRADGIIISGTNLVAVDVVSTALMGFDPHKVRYLSALLHPHSLDLSLEPNEISVASNTPGLTRILHDPSSRLNFELPATWKDALT
jgi:uncharacterized protein (DUF362 family)